MRARALIYPLSFRMTKGEKQNDKGREK